MPYYYYGGGGYRNSGGRGGGYRSSRSSGNYRSSIGGGGYHGGSCHRAPGSSAGGKQSSETPSSSSRAAWAAPYAQSKSKMYTSSGKKIQNPTAYVAAGGRAYGQGGQRIHNPKAYTDAIEASVRQNTNDPKYLYHYTDHKSADKIVQRGKIHASSVGAMGEGTYMTAKQPRCSDKTLLTNNYDGLGGKLDKVESYVRVDADRVSAQNGRSELGRDVWKCPATWT